MSYENKKQGSDREWRNSECNMVAYLHVGHISHAETLFDDYVSGLLQDRPQINHKTQTVNIEANKHVHTSRNLAITMG